MSSCSSVCSIAHRDADERELVPTDFTAVSVMAMAMPYHLSVLALVLVLPNIEHTESA